MPYFPPPPPMPGDEYLNPLTELAKLGLTLQDVDADGFWGRACARLLRKNHLLNKGMDAFKEEVERIMKHLPAEKENEAVLFYLFATSMNVTEDGMNEAKKLYAEFKKSST